jgi:hypothetical protein
MLTKLTVRLEVSSGTKGTRLQATSIDGTKRCQTCFWWNYM